jgi:hypothetical protein
MDIAGLKIKEFSMSKKEAAENDENFARKIEENSRLNQAITNSIIGKGSFCYLALTNLRASGAFIYGVLNIIHKGKYPIYDINVRITEVSRLNPNAKSPEAFADKEYNFEIPLLSKTNPAMQSKIKIPASDKLKFNIFITCRNGIFAQQLRCCKAGGTWKYATKVVKMLPINEKSVYKIIYEDINQGFPLDKNGKVEWE